MVERFAKQISEISEESAAASGARKPRRALSVRITPKRLTPLLARSASEFRKAVLQSAIKSKRDEKAYVRRMAKKFDWTIQTTKAAKAKQK